MRNVDGSMVYLLPDLENILDALDQTIRRGVKNGEYTRGYTDAIDAMRVAIGADCPLVVTVEPKRLRATWGE